MARKIRQFMTVAATVFFALTISAASAQDRNRNANNNQNSDHNKFDDHDRQVARDWYTQHQDHPPAGLRSKDRLSPDEESRLHEGAVLDQQLRKKTHNAPPDLRRDLPQPPPGHRYVVVGGHVGLVDNRYQVRDVIHLHDNR